jgi:hypothetical protein
MSTYFILTLGTYLVVSLSSNVVSNILLTN